MNLSIGEALRIEAENRMLSEKWHAMIVEMDEELEPLWGGPIDDKSIHEMQAVVDEIWDREEARMPAWMRGHFREPKIRLEHGEGLRLPATNIELAFAKPQIRMKETAGA